MLKYGFLNSRGGGEKKNKKSNTDVLIVSCSKYEFPSLSVGAGTVHTQDGGLQDGNIGNGGATGRVHEVTNDGNPKKAGNESVMKEAPISYANRLSPNNNLVMVVPNIDGPGYTKETIRVEYEWNPSRCDTYFIFGHSVDDCPKAPKRVVNRVDKDKGGSSTADDDGFIEVKKNNRVSHKTNPSTGKKKVSTTGNSSKNTGMTNALTLQKRQSSTPLVKKINMFEQQLPEGKGVLVDEDGKPLKKVDYSSDHDSDDEVEPVENEMALFLASKLPGVGYGKRRMVNALQVQLLELYGTHGTTEQATSVKLAFLVLSLPGLRISPLNSIKSSNLRICKDHTRGTHVSEELAWIKWPNVLALFDKGGLGIGSSKSFNLALLQKWRWRMHSNPNVLWVKVIKAFTGKKGVLIIMVAKKYGLWPKIVRNCNHLHWSGILPANSLCFRVGCGTLVRF
nr:RNA-directed DNA polymerase, eukaryota, reverse transcriptase zinc-binding domain protein [Tanacetum cinerariifolium]